VSRPATRRVHSSDQDGYKRRQPIPYTDHIVDGQKPFRRDRQPFPRDRGRGCIRPTIRRRDRHRGDSGGRCVSVDGLDGYSNRGPASSWENTPPGTGRYHSTSATKVVRLKWDGANTGRCHAQPAGHDGRIMGKSRADRGGLSGQPRVAWWSGLRGGGGWAGRRRGEGQGPPNAPGRDLSSRAGGGPGGQKTHAGGGDSRRMGAGATSQGWRMRKVGGGRHRRTRYDGGHIPLGWD